MDYLSFALCILLALASIKLISKAMKKNQSNPLETPPGSPALPIFGNLFSPHIALAELAKTYDPLMMLQLGRVPTVIISSAAIAKEALQKNDLSFSNRTVIDAARALNHHENLLAWLPVAPQWRNLRKICNSQVFSTSRLDASQSLRREKVKDLLTFVRKCSQDCVAVNIGEAAFITTMNLLSNTFFSEDLVHWNSESANQFKKTARSIMEDAGKPNFADYFPLLRVIDPQGIRRRVSVHFQKILDLFNGMIDERLKGKRPSGIIEGNNDVLDTLLGINNQGKTTEIERSKIPVLLLDLFVAGTDTTSSTLEWAMAELLRNPEKLKKAQGELKEIIGEGNSVEEFHIDKLRYLQAVVKETFRLHPAVPFLLPRKVCSDTKLFEFTVPKDAQVLVNVYAIGRDPETWENPNSFEPERFLGLEIDVKGRDFELIPFGAGRRICPGLPLAIRMLHLMLGSLIHGFDWKLEGGISPENMDMEERFGLTLEKNQRLRTIPLQL